jgi:hypothetical protein
MTTLAVGTMREATSRMPTVARFGSPRLVTLSLAYARARLLSTVRGDSPRRSAMARLGSWFAAR